MPPHRAEFSRRNLIRAAVAAPFLAQPHHARSQDATATATPDLAGSALRILLPRHPLSGYDDALRNLVSGWGSLHSVHVILDIIPEEDLPATFDALIEDGSGHDLIGTNAPMLHLADEMEDLSAFQEELALRFGPPAEPVGMATRLPDGRLLAISLAYAPAPLIYRRSIWERYGLPDGPATWEQLHLTGARIWQDEGMNLGFGLSPEPGSERFATMLLSAFGATMLDDAGEIAIASAESLTALQFVASLYRDAMSPESLAWSTKRPAQLLADGIVSIVCDDLTALRLAQVRNREIADDLFLATPPLGPGSSTIATSPATSWRAFHIPRFAANRDAALSLLAALVESSSSLVNASQLADRPAYGSLVPNLVQSGGWLDVDPFGAVPPEKLAILKGSAAWTAWPGAPGPATPLASRAHGEFLLSRMLRRVALGEMTPEQATGEAEAWLRDHATG